MSRVKSQRVSSLSFFICRVWLVVCGIILASAFLSFSFAEEQFIYNAKGKRDPFIPLVTPDGRLLNLDKEEEATKGLLLEGIMYDKYGISYAIVNGRVVKVGDEVIGYQILRIEKNKVIFIKEGQPTEVELKKEGP
jgi:hypothetical protein